MELPSIDDEAFVAAFLRRVLDDRISGLEPRIEHYVPMFPGREEMVRAAWREVDGAGGEPAPALPETGADPPVARRLGPYRLLDVIGGGGQGEVFLAEDTRLRRRVAVKVLHALAATSEELRARFRREALVASRLDHPGICTLFDSGIEGALPYIVMRYVEGESLAKVLARPPDTPARIQERVRLIEETARAVHAAHEAGVLHRDLKPANIMITPRGEPVVLDFGLARLIEGEASYRTRTGDIYGTPSYLAPESLALPPAPADRRTDVYALGVTLYEAVTGRRPFEAPTRDGLYQAILKGAPPEPRTINRLIPADLAVVVLTAIESDCGRRYQSALDLAEDLRRVREREPIRARPLGRTARLVRWLRREPLKAAVSALLLAVAALGGFLWAKWPDLRAQADLRFRDAVERGIEEAFLLVGEGNDLAVEAFAGVVALDRSSKEAIAGKTIALLHRGRAAEALAWLDGQAESVRGDPSLALLRAESLRELGRGTEADAFEAGLEPAADPLGWFIAARREMARGEKGDEAAFGRAVDLMLRVILTEREPRALHHFVLAHAAGSARDARLARSISDSILRKWGDSATAMGYASMALKVVDPEEAVRAAEKAIRLRPGNHVLHRLLGDARVAAGDHRGAAGAHREALRLRPDDFEAHLGLADAREGAGDPPGAIEVYESALRRWPEEPVLLHNIGFVRLGLQEYRAAADAFERALRVAPDHAFSRSHLGMALQELGELDGALENAREALRLQPGRPAFRLNLASVQVSRGALREASQLLTELLDVDPRLFEAHLLRGRALRTLSRPEEALAALRRAVSLRPESLQACCDLGAALIDTGDFEEAISTLQRAMTLEGVGPGLHQSLEQAIGQCRTTLALEAEFPDLGSGSPGREDVPDPVGLAALAAVRDFPAAAAALWAGAFERNPVAAEDLGNRYRFRAACAAVRASSGRGRDARRLTAGDRAQWRRRAREWLEADVRAWGGAAGDGAVPVPRIRAALTRVLDAPAFHGLRQPEEVATLPEAEQERWRSLWEAARDALDDLGR